MEEAGVRVKYQGGLAATAEKGVALRRKGKPINTKQILVSHEDREKN